MIAINILKKLTLNPGNNKKSMNSGACPTVFNKGASPPVHKFRMRFENFVVVRHPLKNGDVLTSCQVEVSFLLSICAIALWL